MRHGKRNEAVAFVKAMAWRPMGLTGRQIRRAPPPGNREFIVELDFSVHAATCLGGACELGF